MSQTKRNMSAWKLYGIENADNYVTICGIEVKHCQKNKYFYRA